MVVGEPCARDSHVAAPRLTLVKQPETHPASGFGGLRREVQNPSSALTLRTDEGPTARATHQLNVNVKRQTVADNTTNFPFDVRQSIARNVEVRHHRYRKCGAVFE